MFEQILDNITGKASDATIKARNILNQTPKGTTINISDLARQTGAQRKTLTNLINREYPDQFNLLGRSEASKQVQQQLKEKRAVTAVTKPTLVSEGRKFTDVRFPSEEMRQNYLNDLEKKKTFPKGSPASKEYSNKALAKKYFGDEKKAFQIERMNQVLSQQEDLQYVKGKPSQSYITRQSRKAESQKYLSDFEKGILRRQETQKKILNSYFKNNPGQLYRNKDVKNLVDAKLIDGKIDLSPRYKSASEYKKLAESGKLFDEFDISPIRGEKRNIQYPVNKNISPGKFNQGFIKQVETYFEKTKGDTTPKVRNNKKQINNFLKKYGYRVEIPGEGYIGAKALPAINRNTGALPNIQNTLNKLGIGNLSRGGQTLGAMGFLKPVGKFLGKAAPPAFAYMSAADIGTKLQEGYTFPEALEYGLIGTDIIGGIKKQSMLTPKEREAQQVINNAMASGAEELGGMGYIQGPSTLSVQEAEGIMQPGLKRVQQQLEEQRAKRRAEVAKRAEGLSSLEDIYGYGP